MNNIKQKRIKEVGYQSEDQLEIKRFLIILGVLLVFILGIYFFTRIFVTKDLLNNKNTEKEPIPGSVNYNTTLIGNMLNLGANEYFVLIYDFEDLNAVYYSSFASNYLKNKELPIYLADLHNELNKKYYNKDNLNLNPSEIANLKVGDLTLFKIKDKKIVNSYNNETEIKTILAYKPTEDTK